MKLLNVLVTRPRKQGERLAVTLSQAGFKPLLAPMIAIEPMGAEYQEDLVLALEKMKDADGIIAISANAFSLARDILNRESILIPKDMHWFAVGNATAESMKSDDILVKTPKAQFDTEGLLELPDFSQIQKKCFVILAGRGGRRKLEQELQLRGARVERIELYERKSLPADEIIEFPEPDAIVAMSGETLMALNNYILFKDFSIFLDTPLFVPSARIAEQAFDLGFRQVRLTQNASEKSLIQALCQLASEV